MPTPIAGACCAWSCLCVHGCCKRCCSRSCTSSSTISRRASPCSFPRCCSAGWPRCAAASARRSWSTPHATCSPICSCADGCERRCLWYGSRMPIPRLTVTKIVAGALEEDLGRGDLTTEACVEAAALGCAELRAREAAVFCGGEIAREVFAQVDPRVSVEIARSDGERVAPGDVVLT